MISNKVQEHIFDITFVIIYVLYFVIALGLSATAPKYLAFLDYYVKIYVSLFLIWRFNPFINSKNICTANLNSFILGRGPSNSTNFWEGIIFLSGIDLPFVCICFDHH